MYGDFGRAQITVGFKVIFHQVNIRLKWTIQLIEHSSVRWSTQTNWPGWSFWGADIPHKIFFHLVFHYLTRWGCSRCFGVSLCCYHTYHLALQGEERLCDCKTSVHRRHDKVGWELRSILRPLVEGTATCSWWNVRRRYWRVSKVFQRRIWKRKFWICKELTPSDLLEG